MNVHKGGTRLMEKLIFLMGIVFLDVFFSKFSIFRELTSKYKIERLEYSNVSIFQLLYFLTKNYQLFPSPLYHLSLNKIGQHKL